MAEGGPGRGRGGRGAIIAKLLEMEKKPGPPPRPSAGDDPPLQQSVVQVAPPKPIGGRGAIMQRLQQQTALEASLQTPEPPVLMPVSQTSIEQPAAVSKGRGRFIQKALEQQSEHALLQQQQPTQPVSQPLPTPQDSKATESGGGDITSVVRRMRRFEINPDEPPTLFRGKSGQEIPITANYISLYLKSGRTATCEYEIRFSPPVDDRAMCEEMIFKQHKELFPVAKIKTFDGVKLYLPCKLPDEAKNFTSVHPVTKELHNASVIFKKERSMTECTHMYNVLFSNIQKELNYVKLKDRQYFSQANAKFIPQHRLEVWPGYVTAVEAYEGGIMLMCNVSSKVLRTQTVLDLIQDLASGSGARDWKTALQKYLIGQSVMTRNPVNCYRVDDIDFTQNPLSTFTKLDGTTMTYVEYYKRTKNITIKDVQQPLLVHRPKPNKRPGGGLLLLVPEVCFLTGLTDEMRSDFKVMKDVAIYTRVSPNQRQASMNAFIDNIRKSPACVKLLDEWGLEVPDETTRMAGRQLPPEQLFFGNNRSDHGSAQADWGRAATNNPMLEIVNVVDWLVVFTQRDEQNAGNFIDTMMKVCPQLGAKVDYPAKQKIRDDKTETYLSTIKNNVGPSVQIVVVIFPSARDDRYSAIKKLCCVDRPIPSQVINARTISRPDKMRSIVQKIALQINCKLGGALWSVKIPFKNAMICGIDSFHDTRNKAQTVAGFVASMNPSITRWHSQVFFQSTGREIGDKLRVALCAALEKYSQVNNQFPDTIIIYRDGVGDGQINVVKEHEVPHLEKAFKSVSPDYSPGLLFIVCQKRIQTRIFVPAGRNDYDNPFPGTIVDHTITRRHHEDFFLVSQLVRQGTVTPTHYIVVHNKTNLDADKIQKLTYKMCHLYYNWPGTVRVPAPCQYAHKLAYLVGNSIHKNPAAILCDKLFFL